MNFFHHHKLARYIVSAVVLTLLVTVYHMITVEGGSRTPKLVMMRLEDIGPGGEYATPEQLGKLRTVLEYLQEQKVTYHLAVIPRWIDITKDGTRYDVSLDQSDNPYVQSYQKILQAAVQGGATLGQHGYSHQVGDVRRDDGHHESGIGNEFNHPGSDETMPAAYGEQRLKEGFGILRRAGLKPQFWEAPHYRSTLEQDLVFRSYYGLHYQAEVQHHRNAHEVLYWNERNTVSGAPTLAAAYVPTPFDYIPYNKDEKVIVDRVGKTDHVPSFFFHPFLDFKHLIPLVTEEGEPMLRDGLPEYRFPEQNKSLLQKLIAGLRAKGYEFYSIQDYVPFTPAHSVKLSGGGDKPLLGDVTGDGQTDLIQWDAKTGEVQVTECRFSGLRNEAMAPSASWAKASHMAGASAAFGQERDGRASLWLISPKGQVERYRAEGRRFVLESSWRSEARPWSSLTALPMPSGDVVLAGLSPDRMQLQGILLSKGEAKMMKPHRFRSEQRGELQLRRNGDGLPALFAAKPGAVSGIELSPDAAGLAWRPVKAELPVPNETGLLKLGDFNGDGLEDVLRWDPDAMRGTVYLKEKIEGYKLLSFFGPWGKSGGTPVIADMDGNGKSDLVLVQREYGMIDTALSFITK